MSETARSQGLARIEAVAGRGMITLKGDMDSRRFKNVLAKALDLPLPDPLRCAFEGARGIGWMAPDEVLIFVPGAEVPEALAALRDKIGDDHITAVDVSDARAQFRLTGPGAREVLAKLSPVDFAPARFVPGTFRRTRLAQVPVAVWQKDADRFGLVCFRSVGGYVAGLLANAAAPGAEVGYFTAGG
ncbi:sarcosine oxidase subunit gamma [Rhodovulum bhavnagarense]|uniref:Sarcosine oxidase subunit gamma n=1 Tax=Rhodovulum bhavnagarense TaxID=992286 RepID=A0A4R2RS80_9RHOB|nr:sarcosine oxidase subunit gamma family protein [Rhodovulum bhavnagarense]TCP62005.1 sarcosine oxidase subunit gamma [Rhodovulum bhavnagarense]